MIEIYLTEWLSILMRWLHLIAGIAWVGASLHFIWLDNSLEEPEDEDKESADQARRELAFRLLNADYSVDQKAEACIKVQRATRKLLYRGGISR